MDKTKLYVARDADNTLCAYPEPPTKDVVQGVWMSEISFSVINDLEEAIPSLKKVEWYDEKPQELEITHTQGGILCQE